MKPLPIASAATHRQTLPSYREKSEIEAWQQADPIEAYAAQLDAGNVQASAESARFRETLIERVKRIVGKAIDPAVSPHIAAERIGELMFSNGTHQPNIDAEPDLLLPRAENPRVQQIAKKHRSAFKDGKPVSKARMFNLSDGIFEAMLHGFETDPTMVAYGEENRDWGGAFGAYRGLTESIPYHRLFNSPISKPRLWRRVLVMPSKVAARSLS